MILQISNLTEDHAKQICNWKYPGVYSIYNYPSWEFIKRNNWAITNIDRRKNEFYSVLNEQNLLFGFFRILPIQNKLILGLGIAPEFCGYGFGHDFVELITKYTQNKFPLQKIYIEVREFNKRAMKCYESVGYVNVEKYYKETPIGGSDFFLFEYKND